jgi:hypothetical protein
MVPFTHHYSLLWTWKRALEGSLLHLELGNIIPFQFLGQPFFLLHIPISDKQGSHNCSHETSVTYFSLWALTTPRAATRERYAKCLSEYVPLANSFHATEAQHHNLDLLQDARLHHKAWVGCSPTHPSPWSQLSAPCIDIPYWHICLTHQPGKKWFLSLFSQA